MKAKLTAAVIFLCSAISIWWLRSSLGYDDGLDSRIVGASAFALGVASAGIFLRPRLSYWVGLVSGFVALSWFVRIESWDFPALNSWILFNLPDFGPNLFLAKLRIIFAVTVVISTTCALLRLLPANWAIGKSILREQTWPALATCSVVIVAWYSVSVSPYRIPVFARIVAPELTMLHVEKKGPQFHETSISVYQDGQFYIERNDRKLFRYRFAIRSGRGVLPENIHAPLRVLAQSTQLRNLRTQPAIPIRSGDAEGWYVHIGQNVLAFTTEYGSTPPKEVVDLFRDLESVVPIETSLGTVADVCLGFCYDPVAGLGLADTSIRCREQNGTHCM
jgi:hypothetical protein